MRTLALVALSAAQPASAAELFVGVAAHAVAFQNACCEERGQGVDIQAGYRTRPLARLLTAELRAQAAASVNTDGGVSFASASALLRFRLFGFYLQPGVGLAVHDGRGEDFQRDNRRRYLGSRVLFAPELVIGRRILPNLAAEVAYTHLSHAQLGGRQNPGLDTLGGRLALTF